MNWKLYNIFNVNFSLNLEKHEIVLTQREDSSNFNVFFVIIINGLTELKIKEKLKIIIIKSIQQWRTISNFQL